MTLTPLYLPSPRSTTSCAESRGSRLGASGKDIGLKIDLEKINSVRFDSDSDAGGRTRFPEGPSFSSSHSGFEASNEANGQKKVTHTFP